MRHKFAYPLAALLIAGTLFTSCKSKDQVVVDDEEEVMIIPCSGSEYFTDGETFRANAFGESIDLNTAKNKALSNARSQLATDIQSVIKLVGDNYVVSREVNNREEVLERFEQNARTVVNQTLVGVRQICEVSTRTKNSDSQQVFRYYVAIELSTEQLTQKYYNALSTEEGLLVDYNYEQFKKTFEEEMSNFRNGN